MKGKNKKCLFWCGDLYEYLLTAAAMITNNQVKNRTREGEY